MDRAGFKAPNGPIQVHSELVTGLQFPHSPPGLQVVPLRPPIPSLVESKWPSWGVWGVVILPLLDPPGVASLGILHRDLLLRVLRLERIGSPKYTQYLK